MERPNRVKAVVMTGPGQVVTQWLPYPDHLEPGAVVLKMEASGICGTDKHAFDGDVTLYAGTQSEQDMVYPCVHGHENSGTVFEMNGKGSEIEYSGKDLKFGDRVTNCPNIICGHCWYCRRIHAYPFCVNHQGVGMTYPSDKFPFLTGGWAEYMYLPLGPSSTRFQQSWTRRKPLCLEIFVVSALLDRAKNYSRSGRSGFRLWRYGRHSGNGCGGHDDGRKGQAARGRKNRLPVDSYDPKLELSKEFGADLAINVTHFSDDELVQLIRDQTEGRGADVVVECVGRPGVLDVGLRMLRREEPTAKRETSSIRGQSRSMSHKHLAAKNVLLIGNTNHPHDGYYQAMEMMIRNRSTFLP